MSGVSASSGAGGGPGAGGASGVSAIAERAEAVRRFNRFYTRRIGVLEEGLLRSEFSLTEARVLWELAHRDGLAPSDLSRGLGLDAGYVSRILQSFARRSLVSRAASAVDRRRSVLSLTARGRRAFGVLDRRSRDEAAAMLRGLPPASQDRMLRSMADIETILGERGAPATAWLLRSGRPGDIGWIVQRHAELYAEEHGFDRSFETFVADIAARFLRHFDARREQCFIAERDGERVGSVVLAAHSQTVGQLRLLLVDPAARGLGIGRRLVEECIGFARRAGYRKLVLWTNSILVPARRLYEQAGFTLAREERHRSFGRDLAGQYWELPLTRTRNARSA